MVERNCGFEHLGQKLKLRRTKAIIMAYLSILLTIQTLISHKLSLILNVPFLKICILYKTKISINFEMFFVALQNEIQLLDIAKE